MLTVAALYVDAKRGPYAGLEGVEPWDEQRDARSYPGPWPVVAHPPCGPWGRLRAQCRLQDRDLGPLAVRQVQRWCGVLEHPAGSLLWQEQNLPRPGEMPVALPSGLWSWSLELDQVAWGHEARKTTWIYVVGQQRVVGLPAAPLPDAQPTRTVQSKVRASTGRADRLPEMSTRRRHLTPVALAQALVDLARQVAG